MTRTRLLWIAVIFTMSIANAPAPHVSGAIWRNPSNSVHIRAQTCDDRICGVVVWANEKAKADARRGGLDQLVGAQLFRDFHQQKQGVWRGRVFVPDIGQTFSGSIRVLGEGRMEAKGCVIGRLGCRSQILTRVQD